MRRLLLSLLLAAGLLVGSAGGAMALSLPNPLSGVGSDIMNAICPPKVAPYPQMPDPVVVARGGGPGGYAQYGYAGLTWTTYDQGCLTSAKADTAIGSQINATANAIDQLTNELQVLALDPNTQTSLDRVIRGALDGLKNAFWNPWSAAGFAMAGLLLVLAVVTGRAGDAIGIGTSAVIVVVAVTGVLLNPNVITDTSNKLTGGVASGVSNSLMHATPSMGGMPASATPAQKAAEGFYSVSYRSWLEGSFCGDLDAYQRYGPRLRNDQAFSVADLQSHTTAAAITALVKAKQADWLNLGTQLAKTNPAAFGCWKGEGSSRMQAAIKHAVVSVSAGFWIDLGSLALLALKWVLRLAMLFLVAFGAFMLFSRRFADRMTEFVLLGFLGPMLVAMGVGTLLWGYYAILTDNRQAWWQAGIAAFALGLAVFMAKGILTQLFVGVREVSRHSSRVVQKGTRMVTKTSDRYRTERHTGAAVAGGAVAGGVAGVVAAEAAERMRGDVGDKAREAVAPAAGSQVPRQGDVEARGDEVDGPAYYLNRARKAAWAAQQARAGGTDPNVLPTTERAGDGRDWAQGTEVADDVPVRADDATAPEVERNTTGVAAPPRRHGRDWRRGALTEQVEADRRVARQAAGLPQTWGAGDDRRDDLDG